MNCSNQRPDTLMQDRQPGWRKAKRAGSRQMMTALACGAPPDAHLAIAGHTIALIDGFADGGVLVGRCAPPHAPGAGGIGAAFVMERQGMSAAPVAFSFRHRCSVVPAAMV